MAYPSQSTIRSYGGACPPSYLAGTLASSYTAGQTFTLGSGAGWYEVSSTGQSTTDPLGTSGPFVVTLDFSTSTEEKVLCSAINVSTGVVTVWTDGTLNGRGYDGTTILAHVIGSTPNCFPVASAVENLQLNSGVVSALTNSSTALSTANSAQTTANTAQTTANAKVASVTAGDSSITVAGTSTAPTVAMPTLSPSPAGSWGTASEVPTITVDAKGRVTAGAITRILTTGTTLTTTATLVTGTLYPCDTTAGTFTVTLPNTSTPGSRFIAIRLSAGSNPVTINAATGQTVNGLASIQLTAIGQAVFMTYSNGGAIWQIIGAAAIPASATGFAVPTGGDLTGTYPAPTLAALSPSPAGTYGSASLVPVITTDSKGRVTSVTTSAPVDATKLPLAGGTLTGGLNGTSATFTGEVTGSDIVASGLTGATTATRYVGGTVNGAPASGTFAKGDFVIDQSGTIWVCTTAGTPGTWTTTISSHLSLRTASATVGRNETSIFSGSTASQTLTAPSSPIDGSTWTVVNKASVSVSLSFTPSMIPLGSGTGTTTYTVSAGGAYSFVNYNGSQWYMVGTNGADHMVDYSSVALSAWGAASSNVAMGSNKITGLADGTASTDAAAFGQVSVKANSAITLNTTAPLAGGGDLTADRTLSIADATTAVKGAVQLTNSTSSTSTTTAATPNSVKTAYDLANAALPLAGGTMNSGAGLNMNSGRILVLGSPGSTGDAARAGDFNQTVAPFNHYNAFGTHLAAWTFDPLMANVTSNYSSNVFFFTAIYIPFSVTVSGVATIIGTAGSGLTASGSNIGLFNATTCLAQTGTTTATNMFGGATGSIQTGGFVAPVTVSAGVYWIGHYLQFSGGASPFLVRSSAQSAAIQNLFTYPTSGSLTNLRAATYGSNGSGTFPATGNALPTGITAAVGDRHTFWALYI